MKPSSLPAKKAFFAKVCATLVAVATTLGTSGCYEGWKRPPGTGERGGGGGPVGPSSKQMGFVLFDVVRPAADAFSSPDCMTGSSSLADYRLAEWEARVRAIEEMLKASAEQYRRIDTLVTAADCRQLRSLETRARSTLGDLPNASTVHSRLALHIKAVFWDEDVPLRSAQLSRNVVQLNWTEIASLSALGFTKTLSIHYSVLSGNTFGNFRMWRDSTPPENRTAGTAINNPRLTSDGMAEIQTTVSNDTQSFAQWLLARVAVL